MSRRALSPPCSPASPMTVPDSPPAPHELDDRTPLERRSMPVPVADAAPRALRGDVTPEFDVPAVAARARSASSRLRRNPRLRTLLLSCLIRCAHAHGTCPNCRAAIDHLPREPGIIRNRCPVSGAWFQYAPRRRPRVRHSLRRGTRLLCANFFTGGCGRAARASAHPGGMLQSPCGGLVRLR